MKHRGGIRLNFFVEKVPLGRVRGGACRLQRRGLSPVASTAANAVITRSACFYLIHSIRADRCRFVRTAGSATGAMGTFPAGAERHAPVRNVPVAPAMLMIHRGQHTADAFARGRLLHIIRKGSPVFPTYIRGIVDPHAQIPQVKNCIFSTIISLKLQIFSGVCR